MNRNSVLGLAILGLSISFCLAQGTAATGTISHEEKSVAPSPTREGVEAWDVLPLEKSGLKVSSIAWAPLSKIETPEYTRELLRVQWRNGDPIDLYVVRPHGVEKPPVILYLYSYPADTDRFRENAWSQRVTKGGFAAVGFVSALTGQRYHNRPMREWFISELQESLATSTHDVQMILNYLATRGDVDVSKVAMFGQGSGGAIAILAAVADPRIEFVDVINPWGDWPDWLKQSAIVPENERGNYLKADFLDKVAMLDPVTYLAKMNAGRVRIEQILGDPATPKSAQDKLSASLPDPKSVLRYKDANAQIQAWTGQNWWLKEQLHPSSMGSIAPNEAH